MSAEQEDKLQLILDEVAKINRGLYGDPVNKVPGMMQSHYDLKAEFDLEKENRKKRTWMIAGFSSAASFSLPVLWEWFKKIFNA